MKLDGRYRKTASDLIVREKELLKRLTLGITLLEQNDDARLAFCFANRALWLQHGWQHGDNPKSRNLTWRPFQLAFILASLESLYDRNSGYRDCVDLLWIPTGGGKTEAYLALMAFAMALRRLRARSEGKREREAGRRNCYYNALYPAPSDDPAGSEDDLGWLRPPNI